MENNYLKSNHLILKLVEEDDANFILELRKNTELNKYLSNTEISEEQQKKWIRDYKEREKKKEEFYFRIEKKDGEQLGFVRVYNINYKEKTFTCGSWIIKTDRPTYSAIESALIVYEFAFLELGMQKAIFDVRKENVGTLNFHKKFGAIKTGESEIDEYFEIPRNLYMNELKNKYIRFINKK